MVAKLLRFCIKLFLSQVGTGLDWPVGWNHDVRVRYVFTPLTVIN